MNSGMTVGGGGGTAGWEHKSGATPRGGTAENNIRIWSEKMRIFTCWRWSYRGQYCRKIDGRTVFSM